MSNLSSEDLNNFKVLLNSDNRNEILNSTTKIAELAKEESTRKIFADKEIINQLVILIAQKDEEISVSSIRALGNIFCDNELAVKLLSETDFKSILNYSYQIDEHSIFLISKINGLLLNALICNEELLQLIQFAYHLKHCVAVLESNEVNISNLDLFEYILKHIYLILECSDELEETCFKECCKSILNLIERSDIESINLSCFQVLNLVVEKLQNNNDVVLMIAEPYCIKKMLYSLELLSGDLDEENEILSKTICDLINSCLLCDKAMENVFDNGKGYCYQIFKSWLKSSNSMLLQTAILNIGNFARNDENSIFLVEDGIATSLFDLIKNEENTLDSIKLQYAILGSLKNMAVPIQNKQLLCEYGLLKALNLLIFENKEDNEITVYKLLGVLRIVLQKQEKPCQELLSKKIFKILEKWYNKFNHINIKFEISRLVTTLIENCNENEEIFRSIDESEDVVQYILLLFSSNHLKMHQEAIRGLYILKNITDTLPVDSKTKLSNYLLKVDQNKSFQEFVEMKLNDMDIEHKRMLSEFLSWLSINKLTN